MPEYEVNDVWTALKLAAKNFVGVTCLGAMAVFWSGLREEFFAVVAALAALQSFVIYFANRRYVVNNHAGTFTFPRSDVENSILEIILLARYWNLMRTKTVCISDIENIYIDTKRWKTSHREFDARGRRGRVVNVNHVLYTLNVAGQFGSANLQFLSKQKRDEVRNALQQSVRLHTGKNIDRKVAEFA